MSSSKGPKYIYAQALLLFWPYYFGQWTKTKRESDLLIKGMINNGDRTEWSPIRSVIIRVINKIGRPRSGSPIC